VPIHQRFTFHRFLSIGAILLVLICLAAAQPPRQDSPTAFRVGERITYSVSFDKFSDVAYAEIYTVSRGTLSGKDAVELRSKFKTLNLVSAAFYEVDEVRTTFVSPDLGMPLYTRRVEDPDGMSKETIGDFLKVPAANLDLLSLIYKIRQTGGSGAASLLEGDKVYTVTFTQAGSENVKVAAGEFETTVVAVQSEYFTEIGIKELRLNLSNDDTRVPVMVRLKMTRGEFRAEAASIQMIVPEPAVTPTPGPVPSVTPKPTPTPVRTPEPYVPNRSLSPELSFALGEALEYRVTAGGRPVGTVVLRARERKEIDSKDTLVLTATVTNAVPDNPVFALNDTITANVDPDSLAPRKIDIKLSSGLSSLNQMAIFDETTGKITYKGKEQVDAPNGTHSILSLIYAMRSFNLKPSKTLSNPVNDTRVAVFWDSQPYVFTLRPSADSVIETAIGRLSSQIIAINTGNAQLDQLSMKIWLGNDERRLPLRFMVGVYQADLVTVSNIPPK